MIRDCFLSLVTLIISLYPRSLIRLFVKGSLVDIKDAYQTARLQVLSLRPAQFLGIYFSRCVRQPFEQQLFCMSAPLYTVSQLNPCPAEPGYTLSLQTV